MAGEKSVQPDMDAFGVSAYDVGAHEPPGSVSDASAYDLEPSGNQRVARQPIWFLLVAGVCIGSSWALLCLGWQSKAANVVAWVLAGPVSVTCVGLFLGADARRRAASVYYTKVWSGAAYRVAAVAAISTSAIASWAIAQWLVRL